MRRAFTVAFMTLMLSAPQVVASKEEPTKKSTATATAKSAPVQSKQSPPQKIPADWRDYSDGMSNFSLKYPPTWAIEPSPALDIPFRIAGKTLAGFKAEMTVQRASSLLEMPDVLSYAQKRIWSKHAPFKLAAEGTDHFGLGQKFSGPWREITFQQGDLEVRQRWYFFRFAEQNNMISFTAPDKDWKNVWSTFDGMLGSLHENQRGKMIHQKPDEERPETKGMRKL